MAFELLIGAIARAMLELIAMNLKAKRLVVRCRVGCRDVDAEHGALLGQRLDVVLRRDDLEGEARVLDDDASHADATGTPAPRDLDLGAVEVGRAQLRRRALAPVIQLAPEDLTRVTHPELVQRREDGVLLPLFRQVVELAPATLARGQRLRSQRLGALLLVIAGAPAGITSGRGRRGARLQEEGPVLDLVREDAVGAVWAVGSTQQSVG